MSLHYNAFISYKHAELDNKVAAEIEKQLEHYHIPKKIQKKTGVKKIERIFRDKDELPITSDLTDTINDALLNSDYLIVLCSKSTHLSTWVEREIKLFLQTHPLDHVLTVLAEGEPYEVIPKVLLTREVERLNSQGQMEKVTEAVEPLSCDWRLPKKEAINTELPRLAAALIGCSYNELMNRQRQYKMRRLTAIAAGVMGLSLGFGAYMLYSNQKINENYRQALMSQSKFLSNEAEQYLDNENRIDALWLALSALPDENNPDRPVIPEAVRAISDATLAYVTEAGSNITSVWNYTMPDTASNFVVRKGKIVGIDKSNNIRAWDKETHEVIYEYTSQDSTSTTIFMADDNTLLIGEMKSLTAIDLEKGEVKWNTDGLNYTHGSDEFVTIGEDAVLVPTYNNMLYKLSIETGEVLDRYDLSDTLKRSYFYNLVLSEDETKIAFTASFENVTDDDCIFIYDLENKEYKYLNILEAGYLQDGEEIKDLFWVDNDNLCFDIRLDYTHSHSYSMGGMDSFLINHTNVYCVSASDFSNKWQYDFTNTTFNSNSGFLSVPAVDGVAYHSGNVCTILNAQTGEVLYNHNVNDTIIGAFVRPSQDLPIYMLEGGKLAMGQASDGIDAVVTMKYFTEGLSKAQASDGYYAYVGGTNSIIYYDTNVYDEEFTLFEDAPTYDLIQASNSAIMGDTLSFITSTDNGLSVAFFDLAGKKYLGDVVIGDDSYSTYKSKVIAAENGKLYISYSDPYDTEKLWLFTIDCETKDVKKTVLADKIYTSDLEIAYKNGKVVFYNSYNKVGKSDRVVDVFDLETEKLVKEYYLPEEEESILVSDIDYCPEHNFIYISGRYDYLINTETGEIANIVHSGNWDRSRFAVVDETSERIFVTDENMIDVFDFAGELIYSIKCPNVRPLGISVCRKNGEAPVIIVPYTDGYLYRYDLETGDYITKSEIARYSTQDEAIFEYDYENSLLFIRRDTVLNMIDLDSWTELSYVTGCLGYHEGTDTFIAYSYKKSSEEKLGYFKHYTVDELIEKAHEFLGNSQMSEELKATYGIGD